MDGSFQKLINRQRIKPRIWDYSYFLLKNNILVFMQFVKLLERNPKNKILDVGCGFKPWQPLFAADKIEYIGIDFDKEMSSADFTGPTNKLPFEDNSFDALIYSEVLEHVDDLPGTLAEMRRVIKPNGLVYISAPFVFPEHGVPHDFQRLTRYYYQKAFGTGLILLQESNSSFSTALLSFNLFIESGPFRIFFVLKNLFYIITNCLAIFVDFITNFVFTRIGKSYRKYFYLMPLGYALIARIEK